ncbi:MAG TPA: serine/threonine-protein kinase [Polyangiaceae bacterium]|nr:serine/threonine-protein kinase [Polyangiaceae bacterium]
MSSNDPKSGPGAAKPLPRPVPKPPVPRSSPGAPATSVKGNPGSSGANRALAPQMTKVGTGPVSGGLGSSPNPDSGERAFPQRASGILQATPVSAQDAPPLPEPSISEDADSIPPPPRPVDPYVGTTFDGRYKIESVLGEGGMGVVYLARHKVIDKKVAIKVLRADMAREKEITDRFLQEAKAASSIGNPHIIDISDFGHLPDGSTYFVMEWLDGQPLGKALEETRPLPVARLANIARQIAEALASAHQRSIVHRDLKPDNIFLIKRGTEPDFVKILDFGIAKVSSGTSKLTRAGSVFGTPHYMSPEQAAGAPVDSRTDIYALGVILYEMASGRVPFDADNFMGILTQHMYKAPVPIRALVPAQDVPPGLEAIILKALSKKPEQRYQTMEELALDIDKLARGAIPDAVPDMISRSGGFNVPADFFSERGMPAPVPATPPQHSARKRWGVYAGVAGVTAAIMIVVGIFAKSSSSTASDSPKAITLAPTGVVEPPKPVEAPPSPPLVEVKQVLFASEPLDSHVFHNGQDLGAPPLTVDVPKGEKVTVEVRRDGFKPQTLTLDGLEPKMKVKLEKLAAAPRPAPARRPSESTPRPASPSSTLGGGEIVNPWAK